MSDYISRKTLSIPIIDFLYSDFLDTEKEYLIVDKILNLISSLPAADVVEVVHCKDCRNYYEYDDFDRSSGQFYKAKECTILQCDLGECGFCSYGERKEDKV